MRNVKDKSRGENQTAYFMFSNLFPKIVPFMRQCLKKAMSKWTLICSMQHRVLHTKTNVHFIFCRRH